MTAAHYTLCAGSHSEGNVYLGLTVCLGVYFRMVQGLEYSVCSFRLMDRAYGSVFYIATGAHGAHVLVGTAALLVRWARLRCGHFSLDHHFGFEASAWY